MHPSDAKSAAGNAGCYLATDGPRTIAAPPPPSLPRVGWQSGYAEHVLPVDLPDVPTRLLAVVIRVDGSYAEYRVLLDGMQLASRALTPEQVTSPDASTYRAEALSWAAAVLATQLLYPLEAAAREACIDVQVLTTFHSKSAKATTELFVPAPVTDTLVRKTLVRKTRGVRARLQKAGARVRKARAQAHRRAAKKGRR